MMPKSFKNTLSRCLVGLMFCLLQGVAHAQLASESAEQLHTAELDNSAAAIAVSAPVRHDAYELTQLAQNDSYTLLGIDNTQQLEFTVRRDQLITSADLDLVFTPSPALLP